MHQELRDGSREHGMALGEREWEWHYSLGLELLMFWFRTGERGRLPSDPSRMVRGVDVLPRVLGPLMGPDEYDIEVGTKLASCDQSLIPLLLRRRTSFPRHCSTCRQRKHGKEIQCCG